MKTTLSVIFGILALMLTPADSQVEAPSDPIAVLKSIQVDNKALLERQTSTLQKLDTMTEVADQIMIFSKRT